jgi:probable HAF family extracellular repeat protein
VTDLDAPTTVYMEDLGTDFVPVAGNAAGDLVGHRLSTNQAAIRKNNGTIVDLGTLGGAQSRATAISDDGTVVVGWAHNASGIENTFRSVNGGPMSGIFFANTNANQGVDLDSDGNVYINLQSGSTRRIYRWDLLSGNSNNLLVSNAQATGVNDSSVVSFVDTSLGNAKYYDGSAHTIAPAGYNPSAGISDSNLTAGVLTSLAAFYKIGEPMAQNIPSILSLGATSASTGVNALDIIVGNTSGTVFMYSLLDDTLIDLNALELLGDPTHVPLYMAELYGITDADVFFGSYTDFNNEVRYFRGSLRPPETGLIAAFSRRTPGRWPWRSLLSTTDQGLPPCPCLRQNTRFQVDRLGLSI